MRSRSAAKAAKARRSADGGATSSLSSMEGLQDACNLIMQATGTWATVLYTVASMDLIAALLAIAVLRPMLKQHHKANNDAAAPKLALAHA